MNKRATIVSRRRPEHWGAVASAARDVADSNRAGSRRDSTTGRVKLHPGWDAAFKRVTVR